MSQAFQAARVTDSVYWVGAIDWAIRDFHGYLTSRGTSYNAYLILADKITLIDTVKAPFVDEMLRRIGSLIDPTDIAYIVSNHAEMDHSGGLPATIETVGPEKVFASAKGVDALSEHYHLDREVVPVGTGESLSLGNMKLSFVETRMLHWPDSMFSYLDEGGVLFSQDAFGMHLASSERFADEIAPDILEYEGAKYYANILLPLSSLVIKLLQQVPELGLDIKIIAPDHGPIWREDIGNILDSYAQWAQQTPTKKAVVVYDTMWQSTALMARAIGEGLRAGGAIPRLMPLRAAHRSDVATEILDAGALVVGSPTMNSNIFPTVADALTYLKGLKPRNLVGAAFGSYGWSGEAVGQIEEVLTQMKVDLAAEGLRVKYVPDDDALAQCHALGQRVAERLNERSHCR
jgi:flavorubredoxin